MLVQRPPLNLVLHQVQPGDWVLVRSWKENPITPRWEGPYQVLLTTDTAVRTVEKEWTHASRIKGPVNPSKFTNDPGWEVKGTPGSLKLTLKKRVSSN